MGNHVAGVTLKKCFYVYSARLPMGSRKRFCGTAWLRGWGLFPIVSAPPATKAMEKQSCQHTNARPHSHNTTAASSVHVSRTWDTRMDSDISGSTRDGCCKCDHGGVGDTAPRASISGGGVGAATRVEAMRICARACGAPVG